MITTGYDSMFNLDFGIFFQTVGSIHYQFEQETVYDPCILGPIISLIKTHGSVSCGPRSRRVTPVNILTGRKKTQFSHLRSSVLP